MNPSVHGYPGPGADGYTPMMQQVLDMKHRQPDCLLMTRMGDFYEMFFSDAEVAAKDLEITLTARESGPHRVPMAGVPHHALDGYLARLVAKGHRVAICEQLEDPRQAKGLVKRDITRLVTAGTLLESSQLPERRHHWLVALRRGRKTWGLACCDVSTGTFRAMVLPDAEAVREELERLQPAELLLPVAPALWEALAWGRGPFVLTPDRWDAEWRRAIPDGSGMTPRPDAWFLPDKGEARIRDHFHVAGLEGFGLKEEPDATGACGAVLAYLAETRRNSLPAFRTIQRLDRSRTMVIDAATQRNLELLGTAREGGSKGSLLDALDETCTAMGGRLLREWLLHPSLERPVIHARQRAVGDLVGRPAVRQQVVALLGRVRDVERLTNRAVAATAQARDLVALKDSLRTLPDLAHALAGLADEGPLANLARHDHDLEGLAERIDVTLVEAPPASLMEGGLIRPGVDPELDRLRSLVEDSQGWLSRLEQQERERTGIRSLKIGHSRTFGYFIEVTHAHRTAIPDEYQRRQTLVNAERFITPELKEHEGELLSAQGRAHQLEYARFTELRDAVAAQAPRLLDLAADLAMLDTLATLAGQAVRWGWTCPDVDEGSDLVLEDARHPVLERLLPAGAYVPNDLRLDTSEHRLLIVTGPNMSGKSTWMRQAALVVILAQMGSWVPARRATVGLVDRIFTRIGAVDDLATGQSTFMVEMNETAAILNQAGPRALILLDEIGRGTSTHDGISIAWAVAEDLASRVKARTLFATHYHEMVALSRSQPGVRSYRVLVQEQEGGIVFLRRVVPGAADRSYGLEVARLAGLPPQVLDRARTVLAEIERRNRLSLSLRQASLDSGQVDQLGLFAEPSVADS
ncbi:MAG: DNA mismatch repair protein MutS [Candidatus Sericytochromatia bacterium]|nr:DNA mismatch repair protein MutS [Candidatus Sericytochromatia bacterium]